MKYRKCVALLVLALFVFSFISPLAIADDLDFAQLGLGEMPTMTEAESGDLLLVYDASAKKGKTMDATSPSIDGDLTVSGDLTFRENLISTGRVNGASTAASSSTNLAPANLPYVVMRKYIGGDGGLDETDGGTRLQNGTPGQVLVVVAMEIMTNGSWIITPNTATTLTTVTLDTKGDMATLLYVDDTIGWIITANTGCVVVYPRQTGIPELP